MPANNPAAYEQIARAYNANPRAVGGFQAMLDDLASFAGIDIAEMNRPDIMGPVRIQDYAPAVRERLARQALGGNYDTSGIRQSRGMLDDIEALLQRLRGGLPDAQLAERLR